MGKKSVDDSQLRVRELLAVIEYLLKKTDENHFSKQQDIVTFAKENYDLDIRRQRIARILEGLYSYPEDTKRLGFVVDAIDSGRVTHYYVSERMLTPAQLIDIDKALKKEKTVISDSKHFGNRIIDMLSNMYLSDYQRQDIDSKYQKTMTRHRPVHNRYIYEKLKDAKDNTIRTTITYMNDSVFKKDVEQGYVYDIIEQLDNYYVYFVRTSHRDLVSIPFGRIVDVKLSDNRKTDFTDLNEIYTSDKYKSIEEEVMDSPIIGCGKNVDISFDFYFSGVPIKFKEQFNKSLIINKMTKEVRGLDGGVKQRTYYHAQINMDGSSFVRWVFKDMNWQKIKNVQPQSIARVITSNMEYSIGLIMPQ